MIHEDLFREVLLSPAYDLRGGRLRIVSGFATANMVDRHMQQLVKQEFNVSIELIIGMTIKVGIQEAQHLAFRKMAEHSSWGIDFTCQYVVRGNPVHAKSYVWLDSREKPVMAFCGSANYTMTGFGGAQIESMAFTDSVDANEFHNYILRNTSDCIQPHIDTQVKMLRSRKGFNDGSPLERVTLSLLDKTSGETPTRSGINWGQRKGRNRDQAYINIPTSIGRSGFFPERFEQFTVLTDDGDSFICVRAQDNGKGLHTTQDNSLLGAYLRARLGVGSGEYVTKQHLDEYGRTDISFSKIDPETYLMDFRPNQEPGEDSGN